MEVRQPWILGYYKNIEPDLGNLEKCVRLYKHYAYLEQYKLSVPRALKLYIKKYSHALHAAHCEWLPAKILKKGRQSAAMSNTYLAMLVWYRFYFGKKQKSKSRAGFSNYEIIASSISIRDEQTCRAVVLDSNLNSICYSDSEATVKRIIKRFREHGFFYDNTVINLNNEIQAEVFCVLVLKMRANEVASHKYEIINFWLNKNDKRQDQ